MAAADSRESTWIRLEIRERIRACARECPCEIAVSRPRRVALCIAPPRRPRRMAFQRSRSRVAQLDPLAWIIESRSITTPRPVINPTPSYLIRVWPAINRSLHSSINSLFNTIFAITGPIVVNWPVIFLRTQFATKRFPCEVVGNVVFGNSSSRFRLYSIVNVSYIGKLKYVRNTSFFTLIRFEYYYACLNIFTFQFSSANLFQQIKKDSKVGSSMVGCWLLSESTMIDFYQYCVTNFNSTFFEFQIRKFGTVETLGNLRIVEITIEDRLKAKEIERECFLIWLNSVITFRR